jgi:DNA-binding beta-propeller fold protein YncE
VAALGQSSAPYSIAKTYTLGGDGFWDYVVPDPPSHRLFVARQTRVMVVDSNTGELVGEVKGVNGAHGTAIVADTGHGFATASGDKAVVMFDLKTLEPLAKIPAADDADAIVYDPASKRVFSLNGDANSATVIEPREGKHVTDIALGGKPEYGQSAGDGKVYVNLVDKAEIVEIDSAAAKVTRRWSTEPCRQPVAMAIDTAHHRLFSGCRSGVLAVSDYRAGKIVATAPIGMGVDGAGYDPATGDVFTANGEGTLTVIHEDSPDKYTVVQNLATSPGSRNMGLDPVSHKIFVVTAKFAPPPAGAPAGRRGTVLPDSFGLFVIQRAGG